MIAGLVEQNYCSHNYCYFVKLKRLYQHGTGHLRISFVKRLLFMLLRASCVCFLALKAIITVGGFGRVFDICAAEGRLRFAKYEISLMHYFTTSITSSIYSGMRSFRKLTSRL